MNSVPTAPTAQSPNRLLEATRDLFDHLDKEQTSWHLRDLLQMATRSDSYRTMGGEAAKQFFTDTIILIETIALLGDALDQIEKEVANV